MCKSRTDFDVTTGRCKINVISRELAVCIASCNTTHCVKTVGSVAAMLFSKNDGLHCCNKLPENNLDLATGP